jgi:hypothetical protein
MRRPGDARLNPQLSAERFAGSGYENTAFNPEEEGEEI